MHFLNETMSMETFNTVGDDYATRDVSIQLCVQESILSVPFKFIVISFMP